LSKIRAYISENFSQEIESLKGKSILLYYPVYVNTFAFAYICNKIREELRSEYKINIETRSFKWDNTVPDNLIDNEIKEDNFDFILCFSADEKQEYFKRIIGENKDQKHFKLYSKTCHYSYFFFRYIFFEDKENIRQIWELSKKYYLSNENIPYLSKLVSLLISRGYQTVSVSSDAGAEAKGLLQKLLYEEYGFAFKLLPSNIGTGNQRKNQVLTVKVKGGQQSYEELERQRTGKSPDKAFRLAVEQQWTSETKIFLLHNVKDSKLGLDTREPINVVEKVIHVVEESAKKIFAWACDNSDTEDLDEFQDIAIKFLEYKIEEVIQSFPPNLDRSQFEEYFERPNKDSLLRSLYNYEIEHSMVRQLFFQAYSNRNKPERSIDTLTCLISEKADSLHLKNLNDFRKCLRHHHYSENQSGGDIFINNTSFDETFLSLYKILCKAALEENVSNNETVEHVLKPGLILLNLTIRNPNGCDDNSLKSKISEVEKKLTPSKLASMDLSLTPFSEIICLYDHLRLIADDLNYFISECHLFNSELIFERFSSLDLSEFEYLFSYTLYKRFRSIADSKSQA
jgi:hypothetical protein